MAPKVRYGAALYSPPALLLGVIQIGLRASVQIALLQLAPAKEDSTRPQTAVGSFNALFQKDDFIICIISSSYLFSFSVIMRCFFCPPLKEFIVHQWKQNLRSMMTFSALIFSMFYGVVVIVFKLTMCLVAK